MQEVVEISGLIFPTRDGAGLRMKLQRSANNDRQVGAAHIAYGRLSDLGLDPRLPHAILLSSCRSLVGLLDRLDPIALPQLVDGQDGLSGCAPILDRVCPFHERSGQRPMAMRLVRPPTDFCTIHVLAPEGAIRTAKPWTDPSHKKLSRCGSASTASIRRFVNGRYERRGWGTFQA